MQNNPYGNPPPYGPPPGGGFGAPPPGGGFGAPGGFGGAPPPGPGGYGPPPGGGALEKASLPAILMMVAMGIGIAFNLLSIVLNLIGTGLGAMGGAGAMDVMSGLAGTIFNFISLFTGGFVIFAMTKMKNGQAWGLSLAGVIVGMLPCVAPCCWFGIPVGIWGLVVLNDEHVKRQFQG